MAFDGKISRQSGESIFPVGVAVEVLMQAVKKNPWTP
jgi:hypothetical protein